MYYKNLQPESNPILLTKEKHIKRLYEVLVLQEVLKLNNTLDLTINNFTRGLEIQFPSKSLSLLLTVYMNLFLLMVLPSHLQKGQGI